MEYFFFGHFLPVSGLWIFVPEKDSLKSLVEAVLECSSKILDRDLQIVDALLLKAGEKLLPLFIVDSEIDKDLLKMLVMVGYELIVPLLGSTPEIQSNINCHLTKLVVELFLNLFIQLLMEYGYSIPDEVIELTLHMAWEGVYMVILLPNIGFN